MVFPTIFWKPPRKITSSGPTTTNPITQWVVDNRTVFFWRPTQIPSNTRIINVWTFNDACIWFWRNRQRTISPVYPTGLFEINCATNVSFTPTPPPASFTVSCGTNAIFKAPFFEVDGHTNVQFTPTPYVVGSFDVNCTTNLIFDFGPATVQTVFAGHTNVQFFVVVGQALHCVTGDGTSPVEEIDNYVY